MKHKLIFPLLVTLVVSSHTCALAADTKMGGRIYAFHTTDLTDNGDGKGFHKFD